MSRRTQAARLIVYALIFVVFGLVGPKMISVISDNTDWMAINDPAVKTPDDPNDHQTEISKGDIVGNNAGDHAVVLNFDDNQTPRIFNNETIGFGIGVGEDNAPPGSTPSFSVDTHANRGGVIDLFLPVDNKPRGAGANTSLGTTTVISALLAAFAENAPIYDFIPIATIDPGETNTDLEWGRESELPRYLRNFVQ